MAKRIPGFTFTGSSSTSADNTYWYIYLKSSGKLTMNLPKTVDVFLVGAGGGSAYLSGGAGGGFTRTINGVQVSAKQGYSVVIGAGGANSGTDSGNASGGTGGNSSAFGFSVNGGSGGTAWVEYGEYASYQHGNGGKGGSGGAGLRGYEDTDALKGGSNGGNGANCWLGTGGAGQGSTTKAFGSGALYATGGQGAYIANSAQCNLFRIGLGGGSTTQHGAANTGGGAGGGKGNGGSGIVIIRGTQEDYIPVTFNGTQLMKLIFNGTDVKHLIYNGTTVYMRRLAEKFGKGRMKRHEICCD